MSTYPSKGPSIQPPQMHVEDPNYNNPNYVPQQTAPVYHPHDAGHPPQQQGFHTNNSYLPPQQPSYPPPQQPSYPPPQQPYPYNNPQMNPTSQPNNGPQYPSQFGGLSLVSKRPQYYTFYFKYYSKQLEMLYEGNFTVERPRMGKQLQIEARKTELLGGFHYSDDSPGFGISAIASQFAEAVSFLDLCLVRYPPWWTNASDVEDPLMLQNLYAEAYKIDPFRQLSSVPGSGYGGESTNLDRVSGEASDPKHHNTRSDDSGQEVVDTEVPETSNES